jgi:ankyrin repeat protein
MEPIVELIEISNIDELSLLLARSGAISNFVDNSGLSILHIAANYSAFEMIELLIAHVISTKEIKQSGPETAENWVNLLNPEGNSAFLFAVMKGSVVEIK